MADPDKLHRFNDYLEYIGGLGAIVFIYVGNAEIRELYRGRFSRSIEEYDALVSCFNYKGERNELKVLDWMFSVFEGTYIEPPVAEVSENTGIYHSGRLWNDIDEYISECDVGKPFIGIVIDAGSWLYQDLSSVDALIEAIENRGYSTIPILFANMVSKGHDLYRSSEQVLCGFFTKDGECVVEAIIVCSGFSLLVNSKTEGTGLATPDSENYLLHTLNVPVIHVMTVRKYTEYSEDVKGMEKSELFTQVVWPEVDGQMTTVPFSMKDGSRVGKTAPISERIDHIVRMTDNWVRLRRTPASERRIAILMYQSMETSGDIGHAGGLDVSESVAAILRNMYDEGYDLGDDCPMTGRDLVDSLMAGVTNNLTNDSDSFIRDHAEALVSVEKYRRDVYDPAPEFNRDGMRENWGEPPGTVQVSDGKIVIPGRLYGNVFVGYQPPRAMFEQLDKVMHDPHIVIPHQYLEYYHWLQYDFKANAVVHMGTHGSIEWLPGKSVGLSRSCYPDLTLDALPHFYPYLINDPGEGIQTKRRTEAVVIGHMSPAMGRAGSYDDTARLESLVQEYLKNRISYTQDRKDSLLELIRETANEHSLLTDMGLTDDVDLETLRDRLEDLNDYLFELKDSIIRTNLHVLGKPPEGTHKKDEAYSIMRLRNGSVPSIREAYAESIGVELDEIMTDPSGTGPDGRLNSEIADEIDSVSWDIVASMVDGRTLDETRSEFGLGHSDDLDVCMRYIRDVLSPNLDRTADELRNLMRGFSGEFVPSGPSGAPTRGGADILPTGRNFYTLDPEAVPTRSSWRSGCRMADQMISRFVEDHGKYPHDIGFIMWATDNMKTNGDDIAYVLWLMGVRPIWSEISNTVTGLEVVPLSELKRPRLDVSIRITGLFRDTFPNIIDLIDDAVDLVCDLDESDEENYLASNLRKEIEEDIEKGIPPDEARRTAKIRMFGSPPGDYGVGVDVLIDSGKWEGTSDLADAYINWSCYAYGKDLYGRRMPEQFLRRFRKSEITIKNMSDRETDIFDIDDVYTYLGGLNALVRAYGDHPLYSVIGDDSDPDRSKTRSLADECRFVFRSKVLNPRFLNGLKEHGYSGVIVLANISKFMIGWDGTSDSLDEWMYDEYCEKFVFDEETLQWMKDQNPDALMDILSNLSEAMERSFWNPDDDVKQRLRDIALEVDERLEDFYDR
ncbi:MAG: cobaltochelatase subunit CobN [Candidatus Methanomethylophilaceae archaeon]|nr:cobaltochelatase subunit CobN [Candidatus Methanomethylophilaceae archaeon]